MNKYPVVLRVFAGINLLIGIIAGLITLILSKEIQTFNVKDAIGYSLFFSFCLWSIISSSIWFFGNRKFSLPAAIFNSIFLALFAGAFIYIGIKEIHSSDGIANFILAFILGIFLIFHVLSFFQASIRQLHGDSNWKSYLISGIIFLLILSPIFTVFYLKNFSSKTIRINSFIISEGDYAEYSIKRINDNNINTWWTPENRNGLNSKLILNFLESEVIGFEILPGSHFPDYPEYGNLFPLNSRLKKVEIIFQDGSKQNIEIPDKDSLQKIFIKPVKTSHITLRIVETTPGKKWNDLCISELYPITRKNYFE